MTTVAGIRPSPPPQTPAEFIYDAFISHSPGDKDWVETELLPPLRAAGLRLLTDNDFAIGSPNLGNREQAVGESRHTVLVLTPEWIANQWADVDLQLARDADPAGRKRRLLPLLLKPCQLPKGIALLAQLDFTAAANRTEKIVRLIGALRSVQEAQSLFPLHNESVTEFARQGLQALGELMRAPGVSTADVQFRVVLQKASEQIEVLSNYKDLHDRLHDLQIHCYAPLLTEISRFPDDEVAQEHLADYDQTLISNIERLREITSRAGYLAAENHWVLTLQRGQDRLRQALANLDKPALEEARRLLGRILGQQPTIINTRLNMAAHHLPLSDLVSALKVVLEAMSSLSLDPDKLIRFEDGVDALDRLRVALALLVADHDAWQGVDNEVRRLEASLEYNPDELRDCWPDIRAQLEALFDRGVEAWVDKLRAEAERLQQALGDRNPGKVRSSFRLCRRQVAERFYQVDFTLKKLCGDLRKVGEPMTAVLEVIG